MADFPTYTKNATVETEPVVVDGPAFIANDPRSAEARWIDQQWRDVESSNLGARHPLSINRDASQVTSDPYNV